MTTLKTIIIDDEIDCIKLLAMELQHFPQVSVEATYTDPLVALQEIEFIKPDLLFLDIEISAWFNSSKIFIFLTFDIFKNNEMIFSLEKLFSKIH